MLRFAGKKNVNDINVALTILTERVMQQMLVCVRAKCQSGRSLTRFLWHKLESFYSTQDGMKGHSGSTPSPVFNPSVPVYQYWIWLQWRIVWFGKVLCPWLHNSNLDPDSKALTTRTTCISQCKIKMSQRKENFNLENQGNSNNNLKRIMWKLLTNESTFCR